MKRLIKIGIMTLLLTLVHTKYEFIMTALRESTHFVEGEKYDLEFEVVTTNTVPSLKLFVVKILSETETSKTQVGYDVTALRFYQDVQGKFFMNIKTYTSDIEGYKFIWSYFSTGVFNDYTSNAQKLRDALNKIGWTNHLLIAGNITWEGVRGPFLKKGLLKLK
jgi:hypothetical protein